MTLIRNTFIRKVIYMQLLLLINLCFSDQALAPIRLIKMHEPTPGS